MRAFRQFQLVYAVTHHHKAEGPMHPPPPTVPLLRSKAVCKVFHILHGMDLHSGWSF